MIDQYTLTRQIVKNIIEEGYRTKCGSEGDYQKAETESGILHHINNEDEVYVKVFNKEGKKVGTLLFVEQSLCDYSESLADIVPEELYI